MPSPSTESAVEPVTKVHLISTGFNRVGPTYRSDVNTTDTGQPFYGTIPGTLDALNFLSEQN